MTSALTAEVQQLHIRCQCYVRVHADCVNVRQIVILP